MSTLPSGAVVILGATSGVARPLAAEFAKHGHPIILAARNVEETETIATDLRVRYRVDVDVLAFDAEDFDAHTAFVDQCIVAAKGSLRGVVLCFGFMDTQENAQRDASIARKTIDVNLTAAVTVLEGFAAHLEKNRSGFIAGLSSVAGDRGRMTNYIYGASKAGFTAYLQGLRNRMAHAGVQVTTIKPGFMDTKMTFGMKLPKPLTASPEQAAAAMYKAIAAGKSTAYVLWFWRYIMTIICAIPEFQFKKMKL